MRVAATCFGFSQPSSGSYCMCFAKAVSINNELKYVVMVPKHGDTQKIIRGGSKLQRWMA